jgi:hypothetical protein
MSDPTPDGVPWLTTSPADYDRRRAVKGHRRDSAEQGALFFTATPTAEAAAPRRREELPGQLDIFGGEA